MCMSKRTLASGCLSLFARVRVPMCMVRFAFSKCEKCCLAADDRLRYFYPVDRATAIAPVRPLSSMLDSLADSVLVAQDGFSFCEVPAGTFNVSGIRMTISLETFDTSVYAITGGAGVYLFSP